MTIVCVARRVCLRAETAVRARPIASLLETTYGTRQRGSVATARHYTLAPGHSRACQKAWAAPPIVGGTEVSRNPLRSGAYRGGLDTARWPGQRSRSSTWSPRSSYFAGSSLAGRWLHGCLPRLRHTHPPSRCAQRPRPRALRRPAASPAEAALAALAPAAPSLQACLQLSPPTVWDPDNKALRPDLPAVCLPKKAKGQKQKTILKSFTQKIFLVHKNHTKTSLPLPPREQSYQRYWMYDLLAF